MIHGPFRKRAFSGCCLFISYRRGCRYPALSDFESGSGRRNSLREVIAARMKDCGFNYYSKRILTILAIAALLTVMLGGCVKKYYQEDIKSYARKLTGREHLSVSEGYVEIQEDEEGYLDHLWTITDEDSGVVFHILDDYYWAEMFPATEGLYLKKTSQSGLVTAEILCGYTDGQSLRKLYEELLSLRTTAVDEGYGDLKVKYTVQYEHPLSSAVEYEVQEGITTGEIGSLDESAYELMRKNYLACVMDYRFDDALKEFTQEEIDALVHAPDTVRIYKTEDGNGSSLTDAEETGDAAADRKQADASKRIYYEGVIGNPQYAGISFGTLYEILRMEGYQVTGNAWHYFFTSPEGNRIEISYDFNDLSGYNDKDGKLRKGYYYMRDDRKVRMKNYYDNHFDTSEIEALTGLKIYEDRPYKAAEEQQEKKE